MRRLVMSRSTATLRDAKRPSYTTVVSLRSASSGRTSPERSSDMNGSRPPPSYAKTSPTSDAAGTAVESRSCAAAGLANATVASASARLATRTRGSRGGGLRGRRCAGRLHERANREFRQQQRARRIAEQLLCRRRGGREREFLRNDDARQGSDIGEVFADLIVVPVYFEPVAIGIERLARFRSERLDLPERNATDLGLGRHNVDQCRHLVAVRHQAPHQLQRALILLHAAAQILDAAAREVGFGSRNDLLEAVGLLIRRRDPRDVGGVLLGPEEVAPGQRREHEQRHDLAALVGW